MSGTDNILTQEDIRHIEAKGLDKHKVFAQLSAFKKGIPFAKLERPCTTGDGIIVIEEDETDKLRDAYSNAALNGRTMKFVPASGAASRMFKLVLGFQERTAMAAKSGQQPRTPKTDNPLEPMLEFVQRLENFAFFEDLEKSMERDNLSLNEMRAEGEEYYSKILDYLLTSKGLNYADTPKGLIKFHTYGNKSRTAFEEHLVEATRYAMDKNKVAKMHFTVAREHLERIQVHLDEAKGGYSRQGVRLQISYSVQKSSTDTIAVDLQDHPYRTPNGDLLFRPGGHGALIENLRELEADIVFIKNIDNVVPDCLKEVTIDYKKLLGGYLVRLQTQIFSFLEVLEDEDIDEPLLDHIADYVRKNLFSAPGSFVGADLDLKKRGLFDYLDRPLRVCGVVKNVRAPGGGPFWVRSSDGEISVQIVEASQVDANSKEQQEIWASASHFNPVDLVCGVRDFRGEPFNLDDFVDKEAGFISRKSIEGAEIKALELPGLWNGAMAHWNTIFVEVPSITFNPVKDVFDLLRVEHQPAGHEG